MTNTELIAKIKAEIERLKSIEYPCDNSQQATGFFNALDIMTDFLSTLESETTYDTQQYTPRPSVSIEDVARVQFASHAKVFDKKRKAVFDWEQFKEVAGIFYGFGKKDHSDTLESEKPMVQDGLEEEMDKFFETMPVLEHENIFEDTFKYIAEHFAEWGYLRAAEKYNEVEYNLQRAEESVPNDLEEAADKFAVFYDQGTCDGIAQDCFKAGAEWDREQMMKEAIGGNAYPNDGEIWVDLARYGYKFKEGEPCRIIIVKEDEK